MISKLHQFVTCAEYSNPVSSLSSQNADKVIKFVSLLAIRGIRLFISDGYEGREKKEGNVECRTLQEPFEREDGFHSVADDGYQ